jgi:anti-sigma regulatory factor (Ser/Thr protein kinase)
VEGGPRFAHELVLHTTDAELFDFVVAFAREGVAAEEPTLLAVRPAVAATLDEIHGPSPHLTVLPVIGQAGRPAADLRATEALLAGHSETAQRLRILNQEPTVPDEHWHEWRRLEAVINIAMQRYEAWAVCLYDQRALGDEHVADLRATHPLIWSHGRHRLNDRFQDPTRFIAGRTAPPDPVEQTTPAAELINPSPAAARAAVNRLSQDARLPADESQHLAYAVSETIVNAIVHGRPPIVLRLWTQPERVVATVTDTGNGPTDPFVGLLPAEHRRRGPSDPGLGLWIIHQLVDVTHRRHPSGHTVRMTASTSHLSAL